MRTHLLILFVVSLGALILLAGCQQPSQPPALPGVGPIEVGGFIQQWEAPLRLGPSDRLTALHLRGDILFAYTEQNSVYALSPSGGQILWTHRVGEPGDRLLPPVVLEGNLSVIPSISTLHKVRARGQAEPAIEIGHSIRSPLAGAEQFVYCGLDYPGGGHLAKIDVTKQVNYTIWEFMSRQAFSSGPVFFQNVLYVGGEDGNVYAVNENRDPVWPLPGGVFKTDGKILADLRADNFGLYVAGADSKLYCLDLNTGKLKWQYFAGTPLLEAPETTADGVYLFVRGQGVVAIDKQSGDYNRKPRWVAQSASGLLAADAQFVYLRDVNNGIIGVDKQTGEIRFRNLRNDLSAFAPNPGGDTIFAATPNGHIFGIKAVTRAGVVGQVVKADFDAAPVVMAE